MLLVVVMLSSSSSSSYSSYSSSPSSLPAVFTLRSGRTSAGRRPRRSRGRSCCRSRSSSARCRRSSAAARRVCLRVKAEAQRALAAADVARYRDLKAKNYISASALDARETAFKAAEAQTRLARNQAGYTTLTAERNGVVSQVLAEAGQVVGVDGGLSTIRSK